VKRQRTTDDENTQPSSSIACLSQQSWSSGITLGGFLGVETLFGGSNSSNTDVKVEPRQTLALTVRQPGAAPSTNSIKAFKASKGNFRTTAQAELLSILLKMPGMPAEAGSTLAELMCSVLQQPPACRMVCK
jgi:hypothetical protein